METFGHVQVELRIKAMQPVLIPGLLTEWCRLSGQDPDYWPALKGPGISCGCILYIGLIGCIVKTGQHTWSLLVGGLSRPCPWTAALPGGASSKQQASGGKLDK